MSAIAGEVRRRHVFYMPGFDPLGPKRYHALYAEHAALQSHVNGMTVKVGPREGDRPHLAHWEVTAVADGQTVHTRYEMLRWDDIVRAHWIGSQTRLWWTSLCTIAHYFRVGAAWRAIAMQRRGPWLLSLPLQAALLLTLWVAGGAAVGAGLSDASAAFRFGFVAAWAAGAALGAGAMVWAVRRFQLPWLMRSFIFTRQLAEDRAPEMGARLELFADRLKTAVESAEADEVLLVGHSSGSMLAVATLSRALEMGLREPPGMACSVLTLGHCTPMWSTLPDAGPFRAALARVSRHLRWAWIDVTAPADGACSALVDPTWGCGEKVPGAASDRPKVVSARFHTLFSASTYAQIVREPMRYHFQYLMSTERSGLYDLFAITAGPLSLARRFAAVRGLPGRGGPRSAASA